MIKFLSVAGAALLTLALPAAASAANGYATGDVNMRSGPGTKYTVITTIHAGAPLTINRCSSWCDVTWGGMRGWVSGKYVTSGQKAAPVYVTPVYVAPVYRPAPVVSFSFGFKSRDRDLDRYHDRDWRHHHRRDRDREHEYQGD